MYVHTQIHYTTFKFSRRVFMGAKFIKIAVNTETHIKFENTVYDAFVTY